MTDDVQLLYSLSNVEIKKLTECLDDLNLTLKQRKFVYFYVMNGNNGVEAVKNAGYTKAKYKKWLENKQKKIENGEELTEKEQYFVDFTILLAQNLVKLSIKNAIKVLQNNLVDNEKLNIPTELIEKYKVMANYDPTMFFDKYGEPVFESLQDVPEKYRCCVESIETKYHGKDADRRTTVIKLVDRKWALDRLDRLIGFTNNPVQDHNINIVHDESIDDRIKRIVEGAKKHKQDYELND